jgi:hypothetical protein
MRCDISLGSPETFHRKTLKKITVDSRCPILLDRDDFVNMEALETETQRDKRCKRFDAAAIVLRTVIGKDPEA